MLLVVVVGADETDRLDAALTHQNKVLVMVDVTVLEIGGLPAEGGPPGRDVGPPGEATGGGHGGPYGHPTGGAVHVVRRWAIAGSLAVVPCVWRSGLQLSA